VDAEGAAAAVVLGLAALVLTANRLPLWQVALIVGLVAAVGLGIEAFFDALVSEG
jgi:hypothetical protein